MPKRPRTEKDKIAARAWYLKNKEIAKLRSKEWHSKNRERSNTLKKDWRLRNPVKHRKQRDEFRWIKYGMVGATVERYDQLMEQQAGLCAICEKPNTHNRNLAWDHDHATGKSRGLLCGSCNSKVGVIEKLKRMELYEKLHAYLEKWDLSQLPKPI